jgi:hypothetical protein
MITNHGSPTDLLLNASLILAPTLMLTSSIVYVVTDELGHGVPGGIVQNLAMICFMLVVIRLTTLVSDSSPKVAAALLLVGIVGVAGGIGYGVNAYAVEVTGVDMNDTAGAAATALQTAGILFPLMFIGFGATLLLTKTVPAPIALALVVGGVLFPLGRIPGIDALALASDVTLLVALTAVAVSTRSTDLEHAAQLTRAAVG